MKRAVLYVLGGIGVFAICVLFGGIGLAQFGRPFNAPLQLAAPEPNYLLRFALVIIPGVLGFVIGLFFSPGLARIRYFLLLGCAALFVFIALFGPVGVGETFSTIAGLAAFIAGIIIGFRLFARAGKRRRLTTFGSADWADLDHVREHGLDRGDGFWLGRYEGAEGQIPIRYNGDRHLLTIAPTRAGKGVSAIVPNLLTYEGSALVVDPKGENALITMLARHKLRQQLLVVDPWEIVVSRFEKFSAARFNPLDWLKAGDPDIAENAMLIADALVVKSEKGNPFWEEEAKALLMGLILHVATDAQEASNRHLGRVRDLIMQDGDDLKALFTRMYDSKNPVVSGTGARCLQKDPELLSNVLASTQAQTHFLDSPRIRASLSKSDFAFEDLKTRRMTVYLVLPADRLNAFGRWLRLLIQQALTVNARNIDRKPQKPVLFLLDEMPALGRLAMVEQAYGLMAGFGMQLWGIVQDASQLKRIYGDGWETFVSNSGVLQYFGSRDQMTAEYFSKLCGVTTIMNLSSSIAHAVSTALGAGSSRTTTTSQADAQRNLAYPDELMTLRKDKQLLLVENMNPISAQKIKWYEDEEFRAKGVNLQAASVAQSVAEPSGRSGSSQTGRGSPMVSRASKA